MEIVTVFSPEIKLTFAGSKLMEESMNRMPIFQTVILTVFLLVSKDLTAQQAKTFTLTEVQELAIANSNQLKLAKTGVDLSQTATQLVQNAQTPSVNVSLSASYIGNAFITDRDLSKHRSIDMPHLGNNFGFEASQVVFAGGAINDNIQKARLEEQIARLNYNRSELDICFLVTGHYLDLYKLKNQRAIFQKNIEQTKLLIEQIRSKESQGMALSNDVTRQELLLQNLKLALIEVDNNQQIINQQLLVTLGLPAEMTIVPDSSVLQLDLNTFTLKQLQQITDAHLPDLKIASLNKEIAVKELRIAKAEYYPQIALVAADHLEGPILIEMPAINKNFNYWYVGVGIRYNMASLYKTNHKVQLASQKKYSAEFADALVRENAQLAVHNSYIKFKESMEKLAVYETSLQLANENYTIINNRYLNDLALITEMLDASNTKLSAELQIVNARLDIIYNYYKMKRETGMLPAKAQ
jgi:outer membrane protein TolC